MNSTDSEFAPQPSPPRPAAPRPLSRWLLLFAIVALGAGLRLYALRDIPPGLWYDEAIYGLDSLSVLEKPGWPLFFTTGGHGREPLYMYWTAGVFALIGHSTPALRASSVLLGLLTILAAWAWAREATDERRALLVAAALALLRWHIHFNRIGFRANLTPLFIALTMWAAWRAFKTRRVVWTAATGFLLGAGFTTYLSFRVVPLLLLVVGAHFWWTQHRTAKLDANAHSDADGPMNNATDDDADTRSRPGADGPMNNAAPEGEGAPASPLALSPPRFAWPHALGFVAALALGLAPTVFDAARHPEHLFMRAGEVTPFSRGVGPGLSLVAKQTRDIALMFFVRGDHVAKHNIPGGVPWAQVYYWRSPGVEEAEIRAEAQRAARLTGDDPPDPHGHGLPVFDPITAAFFLVGVIALASRMGRDTAAFAALAWIAVLSLPSILSFGAPNYLRMFGMTPAVAFVLVAGVETVRGAVARRWGARAGVALVVVFFLHFGAIESKRYFVDWPAHPQTWREFNTEFAELGRFVVDTPPDAAFQVPDYIRLHPTFVFETHRREGIFGFDAEDAERAARGYDAAYVVMPLPPFPPAPVSEDWLRHRAPVEVLDDPDGRPWALLLPGPGKEEIEQPRETGR